MRLVFLALLLPLFIQIPLFASIIGLDDDWSKDLDVELASSPSSHKENVNSDLKELMKDPDGLISKDFSIPDGLFDRVFFWAKIYSVYPSSTYVVHDRDDLSIVYKVVDQRSSSVSPAKARDMVKAIVKRAFKSRDLKDFAPKNNEEKDIYFKVKNKIKDKKVSNVISRIRTQTGQKDFIISGIKVSSRYLPIIEDIFREQGLPWELTRIPFVESSFNIRADSKVGARGIWQIMGDTGKKFIGVEKNYDERFSPFKASIVAAKLLEENHEILGSWPLAITAYNHGPGGLRQASKKLGTKDISKIVNKYDGKNFGFASRNFYSEFLAALYVTVYSDRIFGKIDKEPLMNFFYVEMDSELYIGELAKISMSSISDISKYNPELGKSIVKGDVPIKKRSLVKLPPRASYRLEEYFERLTDTQELRRELGKKR